MENKKKSPWVWIGIGCGIAVAGLVVFVAVILFVVFGAIRKSTPYQEALQRAQNDPRVVAALGSPVKAGLIFSGNIHTENQDGEAKLDIPISGPKGSASLHVVASKMRGRWYYNQIIVTPRSGPEIDLMTSP